MHEALRPPIPFVATRRHWLRPTLAGLLACLTAGSALAQTPADIEAATRQAEQLQRESQERAKQQLEEDLRSARPPTRLEAPTVQVPERAAGPCRDIKEVRIKGASLLKPAALAELAARYSNRCLGVTEIEQLLADITNAYIARGYITVRAYLPQQDLTTGVLEIVVIEGKVEEIRINDGGKGSISVGNVAPGVVGRPLNLRDFEQALDQVNRLASNNASFDIQPGTAPGDSVVVLSNAPSRTWRVGLTYDNQGSAATGKEQVGLNLSFDNPLGLNDFLSLTHRRANPYYEGEESSFSNSLTYVVPHGYATYTLNLSNSEYASLLAAPSGTALHTDGDSEQASLRYDRVVYRDQKSRWNLAATLTGKASRNFLEGILLGVSSRRLTILDLDSSYTTGLAGGVLTLDLGYAQGLSILNALDDADDMLPGSPSAQFGKIKYGASFNLPFKLAGLNLNYSAQLTGQQSRNVLYGSEQISIGGIYTVRGFVRNTLSGDHGYYLRNDLSVRLPFTAPNGQTGSLRPYIALDHGEVTNRVAGIPQGELTGMAVGFTLAFGAINLDLFHGWGIDEPDSMSHEGGATFFRLSATL